MEETRVHKYKAYRDSMITDESITLETSNNGTYTKDIVDTTATSTLPIDQVMGNIKEDNREAAFLRKEKIKKIAIIAAIAIGSAAIVTILVIIGFNVFGR